MNIYENVYIIIEQLLGGAATSTEVLACELVSLTATLFVFILPFLVVWRIIKAIV